MEKTRLFGKGRTEISSISEWWAAKMIQADGEYQANASHKKSALPCFFCDGQGEGANKRLGDMYRELTQMVFLILEHDGGGRGRVSHYRHLYAMGRS